jgi:hypothetical protein
MKKARALSLLLAELLATDCGLAPQSFAECYVRAPLRPVHRTYIRRDVVEPGVYDVRRTPPLHGWTSEAAVHPGGVVWHEEPGVFRTVLTRVRRSGGWTWRHGCVRGQEAICRTKLPDHYMTVERHILVKPGRRWAERVPSTVEYSSRRVLLRPYKNIAHFQRPYIAWTRERVAVQPEGERWVPAGKPDC